MQQDQEAFRAGAVQPGEEGQQRPGLGTVPGIQRDEAQPHPPRLSRV